MSFSKKTARFRPSIRVTVVGIFIVATLITAAMAVGLQYYFSRKLAAEFAVDRFDSLVENTSQYLSRLDDQSVNATQILANNPNLIQDNWVTNNVRELFSVILQGNQALYAIYIGFPNGDFYEVVNLECSADVRQQFKAAETDRWIVISIRGENDDRKRSLEYYSEKFELRVSRDEPSDYNAAVRPWFTQAEKGKINKTPPYLFHNLQAPGQTYSTKINDDAVVAVDIALSTLSEFLSSRNPKEYGDIFLFRKNGDLIASNQAMQKNSATYLDSPPLRLNEHDQEVVNSQGVLRVSNENDWSPIDFAVSGKPKGYSIDYLNLVSKRTGLKFEYVNGYSWDELVKLYTVGEIDILQPIFNDKTNLAGTFSTPFLQLPYSVITQKSHKTIRHIQELNGKSVSVPQGWTIIESLRREYPEIHINIVSSTLDVLHSVRRGDADAGLDVGEILKYTAETYFFNDLKLHPNIDFSPATFPDQLHFLISDKHADVAAIINRAIDTTSNIDKLRLSEKWFGSSQKSQSMLTVPYKQLINQAGIPSQQGVLVEKVVDNNDSYVFVTRLGVHHKSDDFFGIVIPVKNIVKPAIEKVKASLLFTIAFLLVLIPAPWLFASPIVKPIRKLAEENDKIRNRQYGDLSIPGSYIKEINDLGVSMGSMVASIRQHEKNQVALMDSFIKIIATAIDDKSHYTAGHCERVPELAFMLAKKAEASQTPPFDSFLFKSEDEWREFKVGAWLHDCGKITTPEHIVDKGSKLETIYNRIHEVRTRFEVLWRDAEISYWENVCRQPENLEVYREELEKAKSKLRDDFDFVARMNVGGEYLSEDKMQRLHDIAKTPWTRHFSDRLGLSPLEETRIQGDEVPIPCQEFLLSDKPSHILQRQHDTHYAPGLGIKMTIPENIHNQGELYNLSIERGTLTAEDRFKINEHIISTIRMLDALPFPPELSQVPRYASTHHETMNGTGYPRKLNGEQLSIPERIMVLADIFEALTAADRPYKKAKPVSVAIDILAKMVEEKHVDVEVFELFLTSGVYKEYAKQFLPESQLDNVNINQYLRAKSE